MVNYIEYYVTICILVCSHFLVSKCKEDIL